jgi:sulfur carrier protein ThiS
MYSKTLPSYSIDIILFPTKKLLTGGNKSMSSMLSVKVIKLGHGGKELEVAPNTTVEGAIQIAGYSEGLSSQSVTVNGNGAFLTNPLNDGDIIAIAGKVQGG